MSNRPRLLALLVAGAVALGGCGGGGDSEPEALVEGQEGTTTFRGPFRNVDDAPENFGEVTGLAEMVVGKGRTTVDILVSGLTADTFYFGTVNDDECSASDPGGEIYKFDPDGPDEDPNVVKFEMGVLKDKDTKLAAGSNAEATYKKEAGEDARSVVISLKRKKGADEDEKDPPKIACADLKPTDSASPGDASDEDASDEEVSSPSPSPDEDKDASEEESASPSPSPKSKKSASPGPSPDGDS